MILNCLVKVSHFNAGYCISFDGNRQFEMVVPTEDSVITEMTSTLRDWGTMWKQLYVVNAPCAYSGNNFRNKAIKWFYFILLFKKQI